MNERTFQFRLRSSHPAQPRATQDLVVEFLADADADAMAYMQERMKLCPISRNLPDGVHKRIDLSSLG